MVPVKVVIRDISKTYRGGGAEVTALASVNLEIQENEFVSLVGTSGCGKSTLLMIVAGLEPATSGTVMIDSLPVTGPGLDRGVVFQSYTLLPWLTALGNVDPVQLSGGMKQRVAIARALSYRPKMLVMDEPFGALDALTRQHMQELLAHIWEHHRLTVLFVTHDVDEAVYMSDRVAVMTNRPGRIKSVVPIDLPRPRNSDMIGMPAFTERQRQVLQDIRSESIAIAAVGEALSR
jgi:NitT/TauT family transport system ATP-binding protein